MNGVFERLTTAAIVVNVALVGAAQVVTEHEEILEAAHNGILAFFAVELCLHLRAHGWRWLRRPWHAFDAALIVASVLPVLGVDAGLLRMARAARLVHLGKHVSGLRVLRLMVRGGRLAPAAVTVVAALLIATPLAHADPDDPTTEICGAFDLGVPPDQIAERLGENDHRWNVWRSWRAVGPTIVGGDCG